MMKNKLLISVLLLFVGVGMKAQSVDEKQMDERFNDGTKMPYGWFAEGWKVDDGKAKAEATVGKWQACFRSISDVEADKMNIYGMRDDGSWARFQSEGGVEQHRLAAYRGYFEADASSESSANMRAAAKPGTYKTMLERLNQQGTNAGEDGNDDNMEYEGDIPFIESTPDGIQPTIITIDADGNSRYFDLQGRMLNGKPDRGIFIENGKKIIK